MKQILTILFLVPYWIFSQQIQSIEVCTDNQAYLQDYWVANGDNQYFWAVEGGIIQDNNGNSITVNWLNVPYEQYLITVYVISNAGCEGDTAMLIVDVDECSFNGLYIPNSFTPNGDGTNDGFIAVGENIEEMELFIFNRWGELIYESYYMEPWDGTYRGNECQIDVYVWRINYKFIDENFFETDYGHVTLIR